MKALVLVLAASLFAAAASARPLERQIIGAEQDSSRSVDSGDCESFFRTTFTTFAAKVHDREQRELDLTDVKQIKVTSAPEGGLSIRGWNRSTARLVICRHAVANTKVNANRVLGSISVSSRNGQIAVNGPHLDTTQAWWVNMTLYVPRRANIDVRAANGAVAMRNLSGHVIAHATTGGISVAESTGKLKISTDSGGITLDRVSGLVDANSRDGAIAFKVAGSGWPSIEATAADGAHILCTLKGCEDALAAGGNRLRLGEGVPDVRLSSMGGSIWIGPVSY